MADPRAPTDADVAAWTAVRDLAGRFGPDRAAQAAVSASGDPRWPYVLLAAARGAGFGEVRDVLRLDAGELTAIFTASRPAPASPLPPDEATTFPDDDDDSPDPAPGPYATRHRLVLLREVPDPVAASLAGLVPGKRGILAYCAARGDSLAEAAALLGITPDEADAMLRDQAGTHLTRPDG